MSLLTSFKKLITAEPVNLSTHVAQEMARQADGIALPHKSLELKVKLLELGGEARIIKNEEQRVLAHARKLPLEEWAEDFRKKHVADYYNLRNHRTSVVREEQRATFLAYGFLRGRTYAEIERKRYTQPSWDRVERMILQYGPALGSVSQQILKQRLEEWKQAAPPLSVRPVKENQAA